MDFFFYKIIVEFFYNYFVEKNDESETRKKRSDTGLFLGGEGVSWTGGEKIARIAGRSCGERFLINNFPVGVLDMGVEYCANCG